MTKRLDQFAIGIDVGGTGTKFGLVNHRGDESLIGNRSGREAALFAG